MGFQLDAIPILSAGLVRNWQCLKGLQGIDPAGFDQVVILRKSSPFLRFVLTNAETNLSSAERTIMEQYATLCPSEEQVTSRF